MGPAKIQAEVRSVARNADQIMAIAGVNHPWASRLARLYALVTNPGGHLALFKIPRERKKLSWATAPCGYFCWSLAQQLMACPQNVPWGLRRPQVVRVCVLQYSA